MITREEATAYLDRVIEAWKVLRVPLIPEDEIWKEGNVYCIEPCHKHQIHLSDVKPLATALGHPFVRAYFSERSDKVYFHYKGYEIFCLAMDEDKRIRKKASA